MLKHPVLLAVFFAGLIGILILTKQIETPKIFLPKANVVGVSLSILPNIVNLEIGQETTLDLSMNSDNEAVTAIELHLAYDTSKIEVTDIVSTELLPQILGKELQTPQGSNAILLSAPGSNPEKNGVVGRVKIKALQSGKTMLKIDTNTQVSAVGKTGDVLGAAEPSEITIAGNAAAGGAPGTNSSPDAQQNSPQTTEKANEIIQDFITLEASAEGEPSGKQNLITRSTKAISNYFKGLINNINTNLENQAARLFE